ncbi:MAG: thiaminase II [Hyphomicrobiales bacterium]|nr:thiaminase II [Hyphomicrobiales bacterium]
MTSFTEAVWQNVAPIRQAMIAMPFNAELCDGNLSRERFQFYLLQDSAYLKDYARALALAAARSPDSELILEYAKAAEVAIVVERALHEGFLKDFGLTADEIENAEPSPTTLAYTSFLLAKAHGASFEEAVAALLPCFWVYREVGLAIAGKSASGNPYQAWIDTYAGEEFGEAVTRQIAITDRLAMAASPQRRNAMASAFHRSTQLEWMFWDSAYRLEKWPVEPTSR